MRRGQADCSKRATTALFAATALHALVLVALIVAPVRRETPQVTPWPVAPVAPIEVPIEVVTEDLAPGHVDEVAAHAPDERSRTSAEAPADAHGSRSSPAVGHDRTALAEPEPEPAPAPTADAPSSPLPSSDAPPVATTRPAAPPAIGLALGAPNRFVTRAAREQPASTSPAADDRHLRTPAEAKRAVETALREPARQRERELGLGPEGPVLQALGDATSASSAPVKGRAVFRAVADGTGMIVGIEVIECDGGRSGWANAAELARRALQGKKLRMPSTATRAEMRIEILSDWKMPSGHDPGTDVSVLGVPVAKGEGKKSTKVDILDPLPKIVVVELAPDVKVPVPQINLGILAVQGDPADIGAKPRRVVHTRLLDSKVL